MSLNRAPYSAPADKGTFRFDEVIYQPTNSISLQARILSAEKFYFDQKARLAPIDLVVGWDKMSDESIYAAFDFEHSNRQVEWSSSSQPISAAELQRSTALYHVVPANSRIKALLSNIKIGEVWALDGFSVNIKKSSGWQWRPKNRQKASLKQNSQRLNEKILYVNRLEAIPIYDLL